jgi:transglutaminase-like putative cysteine protease
LFFLLQAAAARLVMTDWAPYLYFTQTLGALGVILGLALGVSSFGRRGVRRLAVLYSLVILPWQMTLAVEAQSSFADRLASIGGRLWFSTVQFVTRQPVEDAIFFVAFVSLVFWVVSVAAGYALARHENYLAAVLPGGLITVLVQVYDFYIPVRVWGFALYAFLALILLGRLYLNHNRLIWHQKRMFVTTEALQDLSNSLLAVTVVVTFAAWSIPLSLSGLMSVGKPWRDLTRPIRERLENAVEAIESPYSSGSANNDFYGDSLVLGRNAAQGDTPVFTVRPLDEIEEEPPRYYWRGRVYDTYNNGQWRSSTLFSEDFAPDDNEDFSLLSTQAEETEARFAFTMLLSKQGLMYMPPNVVWVNRPSAVFAARTTEGARDISAWVADPPLAAGDRYQVRALIRGPYVEELRAAGANYPDWVTERYLAVPEDLKQKLEPLARQVAANAQTPYDQAQAITDYLRDEIEYAAALGPAPKETDPLLWVLLDSKKGFCMYYASAEVLMLRSLGIPARMVVGFAQGKADERGVSYTVRKADSHAWPEAYFPDIGWVEFEPTANQEPLQRPDAPLPTPAPNGAGFTPIRPTPNGDIERDPRIDESGITEAPPFAETVAGRLAFALAWALGLAALALVERRFTLTDRVPGLIVRAYARSGSTPPIWVKRWERWNRASSIERSFHAVNLGLIWLGRPQAIHITPQERAKTLKELLPSARQSIDLLLEEHQAALFSRRAGHAAHARRAALSLTAALLRARVSYFWDGIRSRIERLG